MRFDKIFIMSRRWTSCLPGRCLHPPSLSSLRPVSVIQHPDCLRSSMPGHAHNTIHDGVIIPEKVCHPTPETLAPVNTIQFIFSLGFRWAAISTHTISHFSPVLFSRGHLISSNLWLCGEKCHQVTQETRTETKAPPDPPHWCVISWRMFDMIHDSLVFVISDPLILTFSVCSGTGGPPTSGCTSWCWATPPPGPRASASAGWRPTRRPAAPPSSARLGARARVCSPSPTPPSPGTASPSVNRQGPATHSLLVSQVHDSRARVSF